ncbi:MAG: glycosyltransferase family 2 protein [Sphingomonadales bacterium]
MPSPTVAIVILNWNGASLLSTFLPSVMATQYEALKVVVIDNGSSDASVSFLKSTYPQIQIVSLPNNLGFAQGYNQGLQQVEADYFLLLNSDVEVSPSFLQPLVALLEKDSTIAACQPKILSYDNREEFEYAGAAGGWIDRLGYPFARGRVFDQLEKDTGQYDQAVPIFWASGAALFIRASVFRNMGGFDPYFFAHQEEIDLCWRVQLAGYRVFACPQSVVWHKGGSTLSTGNAKKTFLNYRNNHIMLLKNLPFLSLLWVWPLRLALDAVAAWRAFLGGDAGYWWAVAKAHFAAYGWLLWGQKESLFPQRRSGRLQGMYRGSVLWNYFLAGKKTFDRIVQGRS